MLILIKENSKANESLLLHKSFNLFAFLFIQALQSVGCRSQLHNLGVC